MISGDTQGPSRLLQMAIIDANLNGVKSIWFTDRIARGLPENFLPSLAVGKLPMVTDDYNTTGAI